jgi:signal transduction histidine kinase
VKLATVSAALTFVILLLFAGVVGAFAERRIHANFDDDLRATAADLQSQVTISRQGDRIYFKLDPQAAATAAAGGAVVRVVGRSGALLAPRSAPYLGPPVEGVRDVGEYRVISRELFEPERLGADPFEVLPAPVEGAVAYLQYGKPAESVDRTVARVRFFLALGVVGGTLLAFLAGMWVARRAMRPIAGLTRAAQEVARTRDPDISLPRRTEAHDEVTDLANTFEDMLKELSAARTETESALDRQREFVADASHELRTPLTSILANLELLESELEGEPREMASSALRSSRRMRRLVADLLLLARADAGRSVPHAPVDLTDVASQAAGEAESVAADHPLSLDLPQPVIVNGVADDLHRLVLNLIENAFVHTPGGTPVTVSVRREADAAVIEVADRGPGVPPDMRARVFERFARAAGDAGSGVRGSGLGLSIVKAVADAHGGQVELRDAEGGGASFVVRLPAEPADQTSTTTGSTIGRRLSRS